MKRRIFAAGLFLSLLITCTLSACASGGSPSAAPAGTSEAASAAASAGASEAAPAASAVTSEAVPAAAVSESTNDSGDPILWPAKEMPVSLKYDRMWVYSAHAETEDPDTINRIVETVRSLSVGEKANYVVEDYTDILLFTFPDGSTYRLEFEEDNWVTEGSGRLHVEGLTQLRALLDKLL